MPRARPTPDRTESCVDRVHEIIGDERLPAFVRSDAVCPLLVGEGPRRPEGHHEDQRPRAVKRRQLVLDHAESHGRQERPGPAGLAVEEIHDRVALVRVGRIAGRQVDVDGLAPAAERGTRHLDAYGPASHLHERGVVRPREAAEEPVAVDVAVGADEADGEECSERGDREQRSQSGPRPRCRHESGVTPRPLRPACGRLSGP